MNDIHHPRFEAVPRWPGAPPICEYENLPAFKDEKQLNQFKEANSPATSIYEKWFCEKCEHWHFLASGPAPAGMSSGTGRAFTPTVPRYLQNK